jgi:hypothetical protein
MKKKHLFAVTIFISLSIIGGYIFYSYSGQNTIEIVAPAKKASPVRNSLSKDMPKIDEILKVSRSRNSGPYIAENTIPFLDPINSKEKELIAQLLDDLDSAQVLIDNEPNDISVHGGWTLTIENKDGKHISIHTNDNIQREPIIDSNGRQIGESTHSTPIPDKYIINSNGKNTKLYSEEITKWLHEYEINARSSIQRG